LKNSCFTILVTNNPKEAGYACLLANRAYFYCPKNLAIK
jgi:hypothetical protein